MTHTTDQQLYEQWREAYALTYEPNYDEHLEADCKAAFLAGMEASRRAQVVPWMRVIDEAMVNAHLGVADVSDDYATAKEKLNRLICWEIDVSKYFDTATPQPQEAAPVQMPESISNVLEDCRSRAIDYATCPSPYNNTRLETAFQYLEHQVRQLLAQHVIK